MVFGIKNKFMLKLIIFIISVIIMIGSYSFVSALYISMFDITSHRSVGMIFISFYFFIDCLTCFTYNFIHKIQG